MSRPSKSATQSSRRTGLLAIQIDGASKGNPGPAGIGIVLKEGNSSPQSLSFYLGQATNNVAESMALIVALQEALRRNCRQVKVETDSELLARQVSGAYRVKNQELLWLHLLVQHLIAGMERFEIRHIPREQNRQADRLATKAVMEGLKRCGTPRRSLPVPSAPPHQPTLF